MEFRDLRAQYERYQTDIDKAIKEVIASAQFIGGKPVQHLEERLAKFVGTKHCITCANGTDALELVLMAWGIGKGDVVFVPDFTFFSSGEIVSAVGATPIFVDVCEDTFNIDPVQLEKMIQKVEKESALKSKVIITVDLFGLPANYPEIQKIAKRYGLKILEDSAQGFGGNIDGKKAGSFGDAATTSFFPAKPLGCYGDGGAIFTDDDELADMIRSLCVHGKGLNKYDNIRIGKNSRLDTIQAAILDIKLNAFVDHELKDVNMVYKEYTEKLAGKVKTPYIPNGYFSSFAQYTILLDTETIRDELKEYLAQRGIPSMIYYLKPMHMQKAFQLPKFISESDYLVSTSICSRVLSLPMHPYLKKEDQNKVVEAISSFISKI